jgi:hypothetical protein
MCAKARGVAQVVFLKIDWGYMAKRRAAQRGAAYALDARRRANDAQITNKR